jgi:hypothetical protein
LEYVSETDYVRDDPSPEPEDSCLVRMADAGGIMTKNTLGNED